MVEVLLGTAVLCVVLLQSYGYDPMFRSSYGFLVGCDWPMHSTIREWLKITEGGSGLFCGLPHCTEGFQQPLLNKKCFWHVPYQTR
jgi:hypothetical protein